MKLFEMREMLAARGIQLTKSLGQNFLHDGNQLRRIIEAAQLTKADRVLEIGPGLGPLTELLLEKAGRVFAIEKDKRLFDFLNERFKDNSKLHLLYADALECIAADEGGWANWKVVSNLPYSVASPILVELAQSANRPERMVVTLQLEVAQRLVAKPGEKDYSVLTLLVQLDYEPCGFFKIPASCFFPTPDVDSACVTLARRGRPLLADEHRESFARIVKRAFSQRRKVMIKLLKNDWSEPHLVHAFETLKLSHQLRAETLSLEHFTRMTTLLTQ